MNRLKVDDSAANPMETGVALTMELVTSYHWWLRDAEETLNGGWLGIVGWIATAADVFEAAWLAVDADESSQPDFILSIEAFAEAINAYDQEPLPFLPDKAWLGETADRIIRATV